MRRAIGLPAEADALFEFHGGAPSSRRAWWATTTRTTTRRTRMTATATTIRMRMDVSSVAEEFQLFLPSSQDAHRLGCPLDML